MQLLPEAVFAPLLSVTLPDPDGIDDDAYEDVDEWELVLREHLQAAAPAGYTVEAFHRFGGWPRSLQGPVERDVARAASGASRRPGAAETAVVQAAASWQLLLQLDDDPLLQQEYLLGDDGTVYWLVPGEDLAAGDLSRARLGYQCS